MGGIVKLDFIMIKGSCPGVRKRPITLRKAIIEPSTTAAKEEIKLRFIDTSSKYGHGRFQTGEERKAWYGKTKKDKILEAAQKAKERKHKERSAKKRANKKNKMDVDDEKADASDKYLSKTEQKKRKGSIRRILVKRQRAQRRRRH